MPEELSRMAPGSHVDVVEIDPAVMKRAVVFSSWMSTRRCTLTRAMPGVS